jgi:hypothetical protein
LAETPGTGEQGDGSRPDSMPEPACKA